MHNIKQAVAVMPTWKRIVVIVAVVVILAAMIFPAASSNGFVTDLATDMAIWATLAIGLNTVLGWAGLLDLGYIAFFAIGGYTYAILSEHNILQFWPSLLVGILLCAVAAIIIGVPSLRMDSDYLAIMTIGFGEITYIAASNLTSLTGGVNGIYQFKPPSFFGVQISSANGFYVLAIVLLVVCAVVTGFVRYSRLGRSWMSLRTDELSARSIGVPIWRTKLYAYMYGSVWGALAGAIFVAKQSIVSPTSFSMDQSFDVLSAVVIGSMGSIWGSIIGGAAYIFISESFQGVSGNLSGIVFGAVMLVVILVRPQGLVPVAAIGRFVRAPLVRLAELRRVDDAERATANLSALSFAMLHAEDVVVAYGGLRAVDGASIECRSGTVTALIGSNGAGKTTMLNALSGFVAVRSGIIGLRSDETDEDITRLSAEGRARIGIGRTFQTPRLDLGQTVWENIRRGALPSRMRNRDAVASAQDALELVGLSRHSHTNAGELSYGDQRRCEIARALVSRPQFVLLDEPSSGMNDVETAQLADLIRSIAARGTGIVLVEHDMALVREVADQVVAMDAGRELAVGTADEVLADAAVRSRYLGEE